MAYIPPNAVWYTAELVFEITVEKSGRNVVHRNLLLIRAASPDEAYSRAIELGKVSEIEYRNPSGKQVHIAFRGLSKLSVIYDPLDHGAELLFEEIVDLPEKELMDLIPAKTCLAVFRPIEKSIGPDYSSKDALEQAKRILRGK